MRHCPTWWLVVSTAVLALCTIALLVLLAGRILDRIG